MCAPRSTSTTLSIRTFVVSVVKILYDEPFHSIELFTKSTNLPTKLSPQQIAFKVFSGSMYHHDSGEGLTKPSSKYVTNKI
jgi:hypothetical protein